MDRAQFTVPECNTRVDIFPELRDDRLHFYADINARQSPTIAAVLAIIFGAVNDQAPAATLAIPDDFVRQVMSSIGLGTREVAMRSSSPGMVLSLKYLRRTTATLERTRPLTTRDCRPGGALSATEILLTPSGTTMTSDHG